jgi:hypothetical protein
VVVVFVTWCVTWNLRMICCVRMLDTKQEGSWWTGDQHRQHRGTEVRLGIQITNDNQHIDRHTQTYTH